MNKVLSISTTFLIIVILLTLASCNSNHSNQEIKEKIPQNIILLIGDGMANVQISATRYSHGDLNFDRFPYSGQITSHSTRKVTDSAAGGTALSTGHKTDNGMLAMLPDGREVETIAQYASSLGKKTGLLSSARIIHATPAAFAVHHDNRRDDFVIAEKYVDSGIDLLLGAGYNHFLPKAMGGTREDDLNLIEIMGEMGYIFVDDEDKLDEVANANRAIAFLEGANLQKYPERGDQMNQLTKVALENLSKHDEGFFLMIESAQIDWAGHGNDDEWMIQEMIDFDNVIGDVLDFAEEDGNTLVIVTSDHETGGLTLRRGESNEDLNHSFSTDYHTAVSVPVLSYGPSAERFSGYQDNTDVAKHMLSLWGKELKK